jgi:hypothetical protein
MVVVEMIVSVLILATAPAFAVMTGVLRSRSHRRSWGWTKRASKRSTSPTLPHSTPRIAVIHATDVPRSTHRARAEAMTATWFGRLAQVIAAMLHGAIVVAIILSFVRLPPVSRTAIAYASLAPQLLILAWSLRLSPRSMTWAFLIYVAFGTLLVSHLAPDPARILTWASVFALLIIPAIALLSGRAIEALLDEQSHIHLAQIGITVYFELWASVNNSFVGTRSMFLSALACAIAAEHLLLLLLWVIRRRTVPRHLLLLRPFTGLDEHQDLLDDLRDTWRRVGTIALFAGADVATATIRPSLALFARPRTHILSSERDAATIVRRLNTEIEADARFPLNAIYSSRSLWKSAFPMLEKNADVVLMVLGGFNKQHPGCVDELKHLRDHSELRRIVFLLDGQADLPALETLLDGRQIAALAYGRRSNEDRRALFDLLLNVAYGK